MSNTSSEAIAGPTPTKGEYALEATDTFEATNTPKVNQRLGPVYSRLWSFCLFLFGIGK